LDFLFLDGLHVLVQLVRHDGLDQVFNSALDLKVLGLELFRLVGDPGLLHLNELVKREGLGVLRQVYEDCLGKSL
jgi:hypothetical protein